MRNEPTPTRTPNERVKPHDITPKRESHKEHSLDEALDESFPASDPIAITIEKLPPNQPGERGAKLGDEMQ